jgi:hypothetical protein
MVLPPWAIVIVENCVLNCHQEIELVSSLILLQKTGLYIIFFHCIYPDE